MTGGSCRRAASKVNLRGPTVYPAPACSKGVTRHGGPRSHGVPFSIPRVMRPGRSAQRMILVLQLMVQREGQLISHQEGWELFGQKTFVVDDNISQCIHDIRRMLGKAGLRLI